MKLASIEEMRRIEQLADARGHSYSEMMELAGRAVAQMAVLQGMIKAGGRALILVGPGNNGGDGLVAARALLQAGCEVTVYIWKRNVDHDPNYRALTEAGAPRILWADDDGDLRSLREQLRGCALVIDALLGTGAARPIQGQLAHLLGAVKDEVTRRNAPQPRPGEASARFPLEETAADHPSSGGAGQPALPILAVDCPTGLNCDSGALDEAAVPAHLTVTFAYPKWGQLQYPGAGACGRLAVVDIGVPRDLDDLLPVELPARDQVRRLLPPRPGNANKGTFGKVLIAGGSSNYTGAPALSGVAAARAGAGLVTVAVPAPIQPFLAARLLSLTWLPLPGASGRHTDEGAAALRERLAEYDAVLIGPGLTTHDEAAGFVDTLLALPRLESKGGYVFDADALNLLARKPRWPDHLPALSVLTPHPGEMSRLTGRSIGEINGNRIAVAREHAEMWGHVVLLKGAHTVVAHPAGRAAVLPFAEPALAKAGSGDVLAGVIAALLAQGLPAFEAAVAGAYVHGLAGALAGARLGAASVIADDLLAAVGESVANLYAV